MAGTRTAVFVSYRRDDTRHVAGRLGDRLTQRFGHVFMDIDTIDPGVDFTAAIRRAVSECDILLALIGERWADAVDEHGLRRLDDPDDWIVQEIKVALERDIRVVPVLVDAARMPARAELPEALVPLVNRQATALRYESFDADAERLIGAIESALADPARATGASGAHGSSAVPDAATTQGERAGELSGVVPTPDDARETDDGTAGPDADGTADQEGDQAGDTDAEGGRDDGERRRRALWIAVTAVLVIAALAVAGALLRGRTAPPGEATGTDPSAAEVTGPSSPPGIPLAEPLPPEVLVVPREETAEYSELFLVDSGSRTVGSAIDTGGYEAAFPVLVPGRGAVVYQTAAREQRDETEVEVKTLRVVASDGTGDRELFDRPEDCQWMLRPSWNPTELDQIAVPCLGYDRRFSLRIYRLDGEVVRTLASEQEWIDDVTFSPDGGTVTYATGTDAAPVITSIPAEGGTPEPLAEGRDPTWSPDGDRIVFISPAYSQELRPSTIHVMDPDGSNVVDLTSGQYADQNPSWSPDGEQVVFRSDRGSADGTLRAWLVAADGGEPRELVPGDAVEVKPPAWASR